MRNVTASAQRRRIKGLLVRRSEAGMTGHPAPRSGPAYFTRFRYERGGIMSVGMGGSALLTTMDWPAGMARPEDRERLARYAEALAFYRGDQWLGRRRRGETRLTFNYARALVRKVASYVFPAPVTFSVPSEGGPGEDAAASRAERAVAALGADLDLARLDIELCVDASVLGDGAL